MRVIIALSSVLSLLAACGEDSTNFDYPAFPPVTYVDGSVGPDAKIFMDAALPTDPLINEVNISDDQSPDIAEYVEIFGDASTDYTGYTILVLEGDAATVGVIDLAVTVGNTNAGGFFATTLPSDNTYENQSQTVLLVEGFSGAETDDLDTDDDGTLDVMPWTRVVDAVALDDGGGADVFYTTIAATLYGPTLTTGANGGFSLIPDGADTNMVGDWLPNPEDGAAGGTGEADRTPGATNTEGT